MTAVLQRKLAQAQSEQATSDMTALRALRLSVARAGDALFDLPLAMLGGTQARGAPEEITARLSDADLLMVLECPGGLTGAVALGLPLVTSLIQQQTMGQVSDRAPDARVFTDTDAAMCAPLIEDVLRRSCELAEVEADQTCFRNLRYGARGEDVRTVVLGLQAKRYRIFQLTLDIALGLHQASLTLVLPDGEDEPADSEQVVGPEVERKADSPMLDVPVQMNAVLARFHLSLHELNALKPGDTFQITRSQLDETTLVSISGHVVAKGRLGRLKDHRAVRLMSSSPPAVPDMTDAPAEFDQQATPLPPAPELTLEDPLSEVRAFDTDLDPDALANLSPEEAADQITELAGLTESDLSAEAANLVAADPFDAQLPAIPGQTSP